MHLDSQSPARASSPLQSANLVYAAKSHSEVAELASDFPLALLPDAKKRRSHRVRQLVSSVTLIWAICLVILLTGVARKARCQPMLLYVEVSRN